jgi:hypothetical protein
VLDGAVEAAVEVHRQAELAQVGLDHARHVRVLQLACDLAAVGQRGAVDLAEAGGGGGLAAEGGEARFPLRPQLSRHAPAHEGPAHRRRVGLERGELDRVLRRQRVRDGGEELRHLHQRALQPAENRREVTRVRGAVGADAEEALAGDARGDAAHRAGGARHPAQLAEQRAFLVAAGAPPCFRHAARPPARR